MSSELCNKQSFSVFLAIFFDGPNDYIALSLIDILFIIGKFEVFMDAPLPFEATTAAAADSCRRKWSQGNRLDDSPRDSRQEMGWELGGGSPTLRLASERKLREWGAAKRWEGER